METNEKLINYNFKMLSAIGIILVVSGHFGSGALTIGGLYNYDTFHMPLFIFISGYFFKTDNCKTILSVFKYLKKKFFHLIIPYYIWNFIYMMFAYLIQNVWQTKFTIYKGDFSILSFFKNSLYLANGYEYNVASWFIQALFLVECIYCIIRYLLQKCHINWEIILFILFFSIAWCGVLISQSLWTSSWKIVITRTMYLLFWYEAAVFYRVYLEKKCESISTTFAIIINITITAFIIELVGDYNQIIYVSSFTGTPLYIFTRATLGIAFWIRICKIIPFRVQSCKLVTYIGNHTFSLMMHQGIVGIIVNYFILKLNITQEFDENLYFSQIWYGVGNYAFHIIYVIFIPLIILSGIYIYENVKKKIFSKIADSSMRCKGR